LWSAAALSASSVGVSPFAVGSDSSMSSSASVVLSVATSFATRSVSGGGQKAYAVGMPATTSAVTMRLRRHCESSWLVSFATERAPRPTFEPTLPAVMVRVPRFWVML
jgi:hypothetical protein